MALEGLKTPLTFAPRGGFVVVRDADYVQTQVRQVVNVKAGDASGTFRGEYWWRTEMGSIMDLARHHPIEILEDLMRTFVQDALSTWVPEALFHSVLVERTTGRLAGRASVGWTFRRELQPRFTEQIR